MKKVPSSTLTKAPRFVDLQFGRRLNKKSQNAILWGLFLIKKYGAGFPSCQMVVEHQNISVTVTELPPEDETATNFSLQGTKEGKPFKLTLEVDVELLAMTIHQFGDTLKLTDKWIEFKKKVRRHAPKQFVLN